MLGTKIEKSKVGLNESGRVDWNCFENILCVHLAQFGFHGQTIANHTGLSRAQVYSRLHTVGIQLRDYRDGETQPARIIINKYSIKTIVPKVVEILRNQTVTPINL